MGGPPPSHEKPSTLHRLHPTSVAFFDESGAIASDRFFGVGLVRIEDHSKVFKDLREIRKKHRHWDEFKWATVTGRNYAATEAVLDLVLSSTKFSCFIADRHVADPVSRSGTPFAPTRSWPRSCSSGVFAPMRS